MKPYTALLLLAGLLCLSPKPAGPVIMKDDLLNGRPVTTVYGNIDSVKGTILVLPGWNFSRKSWLDNTRLTHIAMEHNYRLILPEMGKSIYASQVFAETRKDWQSLATMHFISDTLLPYFQKQGILLPGQDNYLLGLSTGGRGAVLIAMKHPGVFKAGAAFSGDYDQTLTPGDNLCRGWYGPMAQFRSRWEQVDNPAFNAELLKTPFYLSHGKKDQVVSWEQTRMMGKMLAVKNPSLNVKVVFNDTAGHNYGFWNAELDSAFSFFSRF